MSEIKMTKNNKKEFAPYEVNGYMINEPLSTNNAGNCTWGFARKYKKEFFIKQFLNPKFPDADADMYEETRKKMVDKCEAWYTTHERVYDAIINCNGSNLINPLDFFLCKNTYYLVTEKVKPCDVKFEDIYKKSDEQKVIIMKVLAHELSCLARYNIIHSDLKPENLILKSTAKNFFTVKIIDFDASFLATAPPEPDDMTGDMIYYSPEMILYMNEAEVQITPKSDVFALGIIFHIILCGKIPDYNMEDFEGLGMAVLNGFMPVINPDIKPEYKKIILDMLCADAENRPSAEEVLFRLRQVDGFVPEIKPIPVSEPAHKSSVVISKKENKPKEPVSKNGVIINMKRS